MNRAVRAPVLVIGVVLAVAVASIVALVIVRPFGSPTSAALPAPQYIDETATSGIDHAYEGEYIHFVGGGAAVFDCDDDGRPELFLAGGSEPAGLFRNRSDVGGALRFERLPVPLTDMTGVTGAYPIDIDGDARTDLAVLRVGENVVLRGLGACRFERGNEGFGFDGGDAWTTAFSATWEGPDVLPTLAIGNYRGLDGDGEPTQSCADSELLRPDPATGRYGAPVPLTPGWCTLSMLFSDWDGSGRRDLRVSNDRHYNRDGEEQLWRVVQGEAPRAYTREDGWAPVRIWGMGIASQDLTGDGRPEVYLTSQGDNKLQTLTEGATGPTYADIALERGATAHRPFTGDVILPSTAWHAEFDDVNNDSLMDLFVAKGNVEAMPDFAARDPSNLLIGQGDGSFIEGAEAAGVLNFDRARGAAVTDLNLDGLLDLVVVNRRENVRLWRNVGAGDAASPAPMGHWLGIRLAQDGANTDAIGARIEARIGGRTLDREVTIGGGHAGGELGWTHLGLGTAERADVRLRWPDGTVGPWMTIDADQFVIIDRDATEPRSWVPAD